MSTIKDVARLAGVGVGTASRALSGKGAVSADALARVKAAIEQLDFRPSNVARALSSKTLGMIGVYLPDFAGSFYGPILQVLDRELREAEHHMVATNGCGAGDARQLALEGIHFLMQRECDGILALSNDLLESDLRHLHERYPRLVAINRVVPGLEADCFSPDHDFGGRLAAQCLLSRGHREIAVISGPHRAADNEARLAGFHAELASHGVTVAPGLQADGDFSHESGDRAMRELMAHGQRFTAVFAANDLMAMAAMGALATAGLSVPRDVSVVGYDDADFAPYTTPRLTSVHIPIDVVARNATRRLLKLCYGLQRPMSTAFAPSLTWRASVGPPPGPPASPPSTVPRARRG